MPSAGAIVNRRLLIIILSALGFITFTFLGLSRSRAGDLSYANTPVHQVSVDDSTLKGGAIMPKLGNETLKYTSLSLPTRCQ